MFTSKQDDECEEPTLHECQPKLTFIICVFFFVIEIFLFYYCYSLVYSLNLYPRDDLIPFIMYASCCIHIVGCSQILASMQRYYCIDVKTTIHLSYAISVSLLHSCDNSAHPNHLFQCNVHSSNHIELSSNHHIKSINIIKSCIILLDHPNLHQCISHPWNTK